MQVRAGLTLALALAAHAVCASPKVIAVDVNGMVHPITAEIVEGALAQARNENASLVLVRLNTPGGLMDAMRETIEKMVASPVPVVTYVAPSGGRAASAGFFLLEAGDVAAMAPGTATGAAHPVLMGGRDGCRDEAESGERRGGVPAQHLRKAGAQQRAGGDSRARKQILHRARGAGPETGRFDRAGRAATAGGARRPHGDALRRHGDHAAHGGRGDRGVRRTLRQKIISAIADPNIALVLLVIGALGIYVEFSSPGLIAPGVFGGILVLLGLSAISVLPINWLGAALLVLAFTLFVLEVKFTSHGVLGAGGALAMVLGSVMLVESPVPELRIHWSTALAVTLPFSAITVFLLTIAVRARRNKVETGVEGMIGQIGEALTPLAPEGKVFVRGEYWNAVALRPVAAGARVKVTAIDRLTLTVEPAE